MMIDHLFIKNYKAFDRENIPLDKHTLLIGSHDSGKTSILEALDLFFNHALNRCHIRDIDKDVVVEIHVNDERYRKVFSPPNFLINYKKCIGNMFDINHIKYIYIPHTINNAKLLNDILTINMAKKIEPTELQKANKIFDYIDGTLGNSNFPLFQVQTNYQMNINEDITFNSEDYTRIISNITYQYLIIGIDNFEDNFNTKALKEITHYSYQTILATDNKDVVEEFDYFVHALYKDDVTTEFDTIRKQVSSSNHKTYLLVEGKYDVAWFETALKLLHKNEDYRVIPCGGYGNIEYVQEQLEKEGFNTIVITDGDVHKQSSLQRDIIELYADVDYINKRFHTDFDRLPENKVKFFKRIKVKDDIVKKILSSWARKNLDLYNPFVLELNSILKEHASA
jgi:predicted ATP-dependent endonuclease of OLD family